MADNSKIEWTDATWNPVRGCSRVSRGCGGPQHQGGCYAEQLAARFSDPGQAFHGFAERTPHGGRWTGKVELLEHMLAVPLRWKRPRRIFVNSMSDLFHEELADEAIDQVFAIMAMAYWHTFQVLTKRSARMLAYMNTPERKRIVGEAVLPWRFASNGPFHNVWLGVSCERQEEADERIPDLLQTPAAVRFVSAEPLLGPIDFTVDTEIGPLSYLKRHNIMDNTPTHRVDWVIVGGESGPQARPMHPDWTRSIRDQCAAAGVPFFFKQWGEWAPIDAQLDPDPNARLEIRLVTPDGKHLSDADVDRCDFPNSSRFVYRIGKKAAGRLLAGREHNDFPGAAA